MLGPGCICNTNQITIGPGVGTPMAGSYGGAQYPTLPPPSGGPFTPVPMPMTIESGQTTVCNPAQTVSKTRVHFYPASIQAPTTGETHFQGRIKNMSTGMFIHKNDYVLQWWINIQNQGCATNMPPGIPNDKKFPIQPGALYQITAHFKPTTVPSPPATIQLEGAWTF